MTATPGKTFDQLIAQLEFELYVNKCNGKPVILTLGGPSASGKSTTVARLADHFGEISTLGTDDYYIGRTAMQSKLPWPHKNCFDHPLAIDMGLLVGHLCQLKRHESIERPVYSMLTSEPTGETVTVGPSPLIIVEGIFANHKDIKYWATITASTMRSVEARLARRIERDVIRTGQTEQEIRAYFTEVAEYNYQGYCAENDHNVDFYLAT